MEKINKVVVDEKPQFHKYCMHISKYVFRLLLNVHYIKKKSRCVSKDTVFGAFVA